MKTITIIQPKGGVGASTVAITVAIFAAQAGQRVLLIDPDDTGDHPALLGVGQPTEPGPIRVAVGGGSGNSGGSPTIWLAADSLIAATAEFDLRIVDAGVHPASRYHVNGETVVMVVDNSYASIRRARNHYHFGRVDQFVVIEEAGRAISAAEAAGVLDTTPIVIPRDPAIARAADAGLFGLTPKPKALAPLGRVLANT